MALYLSILRGINVSGQKKVPMADLKKLYEDLGFKNVKTYIQSGNVIFETKENKTLVSQIEKAIRNKFGFEVPVILRTLPELENIIGNNPFLKNKSVDLTKLYITFLAAAPSEERINIIHPKDYLPDTFQLIDKEIYLYCPKDGYGNTKLNNNFFESKLKVTATTRNWNTCNTLLNLMKTY